MSSKTSRFNKCTTGVAGNFLARTDADMFRVLTLALRNKITNPALADVQILKVSASPDLSSARVFVTGGTKELASCAHIFKSEIANNMRIKRIPNLKFIVDNGDDNTARVNELLAIINKDKENNGDNN